MLFSTLTLLAILAVGIWAYAAASYSPSDPETPVKLNRTSAQLVTSSRGMNMAAAGNSGIRLSVEVTSWSLVDRSVTLVVSCQLEPDSLPPALRKQFHADGIPVLVDGFAETQIVLLQPKSTPDDGQKTYACRKASLTGATRGNPAAYPFDQYTSAIGFVPPADTWLTVRAVLGPSWTDPFNVYVRDIGDRDVFEDDPAELAPLLLTAQRLKTSTAFALLVALTPLFLLIIAGAELLGAFRGKQTQAAATRLPLEMGVAFLALITLRQVLVPGVIDAPTVIDMILALQLALFVLALVASWRMRGLGAPPGPL
jgi:hypothetical protein